MDILTKGQDSYTTKMTHNTPAAKVNCHLSMYKQCILQLIEEDVPLTKLKWNKLIDWGH